MRNAVKTARNKINAFVREVVKDKNVDPSHGWRHRFKTVGIDQAVEMRVLDALQGHAPRNVSGGLWRRDHRRKPTPLRSLRSLISDKASFMTGARRTIRLFFSWQSDLNPEVTTRAIRSALRAAMTDVEKDHPVDIVLDEATRNVSGSPYIPYAIADKISKADLFVGDITTVIRREGQSGKSFPNPNVTFELGIAAAELGWSRIIMLFNSALAALDDLPFDFDRHRISKFEFPADDNQHKRHADNLRKLAHAAIAQIVADDPKRPRELQEIPPEKIKRSRDIDNLRLFLDRVNTDYLEEHILDLPNYLIGPELAGLGAAASGIEHWGGGLVGKQFCRLLQQNEPVSSRLANRHTPVPSQ